VKSRPRRIVGFALISADGMIAEGDGSFPQAIANDADQAFFHAELNQLDACVHGRYSHEGGPDADKRARILITRQVEALEPDTALPRTMLWNPAGAPFTEAWRSLDLPNGTLAVLGGTDVFGMFLTIGYDAFNLSRNDKALVPGGRPVFPGVPQQAPEDVLTRHRLKPGPKRVLDPAADVSLVTWTR
jgi:hypothetical protein